MQRRAAALVTIALLSGCITVAPAASPTAAPTQPSATVIPATPTGPVVTQPPEPTPTTEPDPTPTTEVTPDPNITLDPNATPFPTPVDLLPFLTSEILVVNLSDQVLAVTVTLVDTESTDEYSVGTFEVQSDQVTAQGVVPARFRLEFDYPGGADADAGTCLIDIGEEQLQFAVIAGGGILSTSAGEPADAAEMIIATATRCRAGSV